jgi:isopenicillin-N epimerase
MNEDWSAVRAAMMLDPAVTYLNTGSYGITPRPVFERVTALREEMARNPVDFLWRRRGPELLWLARERLARFLHVEPRRLIFTQNVSLSMNIVASSLRLATPGEVLLTNHEYGAMRFVWERATQRQGLTLRYVKLPEPARDPAEFAAAVTSAFRPETRLLMISHVAYTTGTIAPLREICAEARRQGVLTVIDGAHAPGMIPLNLEELGCDFYGANLHKWLCAPIGAGFLYAATGQEDRLEPQNVSWGWHYERGKADERDEFGGTHRQRAFEFEGSRDITPWLVAPDAIDFQEQLGPERIRARHRELSDRVRQKLAGIPGLTLVTSNHPAMRGGLTAFRLGAFDLPRLRKILYEENRIEVNVIEALPGNFLRVSTHFYNTEEEVDRLAAVLPDALERSRLA